MATQAQSKASKAAFKTLEEMWQSIGASVLQAYRAEIFTQSERVARGRYKVKIDQSTLVKESQYEVEGEKGEVNFYSPFYYKQLDEGQKPGNRVPIAALILWIKKYQIKGDGLSTNELAYVIQNSIFKKGVQARNFLKPTYLQAIEIASSLIVRDLEIIGAQILGGVNEKN